jgi:hypothetical protein
VGLDPCAVAPLIHTPSSCSLLQPFTRISTMARLEEIVERVDRRLEELREESTRLHAALKALGRDDSSANRRPHAGRKAKPAVNGVDRRDLVRPTSNSGFTLTEPIAAGADGWTQDPPVERAIRQLRQELAAGLRG